MHTEEKVSVSGKSRLSFLQTKKKRIGVCVCVCVWAFSVVAHETASLLTIKSKKKEDI